MQFLYQSKNQEGRIIEGKIESATESAAVDILQSKGYIVLSLVPVKSDLFSIDINQYFAKPSNKDVVVFTRQLSTLVGADMPIAEGLRTLAKQIEKPTFKKVISQISDKVVGGSSLSGALSEYPKLFSNFYIKMVRSGELSGKLQDTLNYLADYMERTQAITSKIRGALAYPGFVMFAMVVVGLVMGIYVLPQLLTIFKEGGADVTASLPITTKILIWSTDFLNENLVLIIGALVALTASGIGYLSTESGKIAFDDFKIRIPIFGKVLRNLYLARIAETLSTLIRSDISILDALRITGDLVGNLNYQRIINETEEGVRGGGSISAVFEKYSEIPALMTSMISIGEKTGKLDFMLGHVSKFYQTESEEDIKNISQLIEPVLIFILGGGVAILVSSVLLPIYSLVGSG
jgi:type II secretory pathway component PulF